MAITYEKIVDANKGISYTDVRGKNYAEVAQRVQAFRKIIPGGFIVPEIINIDNGIVYMKAEAGYYAEDGSRIVLAVGHAFERQDASKINNTSYIENCETSAVGRALGFIGLGSEKSIASAEEVDNAIKTQEAIESGELPPPPRPADVSTAPTLPHPDNPVQTYLAQERGNLQKARQISVEENNELFTKQLAILRANKLVPAKSLSAYTMPEAQNLIKLMYERFKPTGTELKDVDGV